MSVQDNLNKFKNVKRCGGGWTALCPSHKDAHNSLSIGEGDGGRLLLNCHANAGCTYESILRAVGIDRKGQRRIAATYEYHDEQGNILFQAIRYEPKDFSQRRPDGGGWVYKLDGVRRVPYRLPELLANPAQPVFIVEGEKDADRLAALGFVATTNAGGAGKWRGEYSEYLRGRNVVILPDNDEPGRKHAAKVARLIQGVVASIRILELPGLPPKGDVSDWLDAGGVVDELLVLADSTPTLTVEMLAAPRETSPSVAPLQIVRMADVKPEMVRWLWEPYIPLGKLTLLEGDPGLGKSWLTCSLAAAVSRGAQKPVRFELGNVLMLSAEDGLADTLRPRLDAVGADASRVLALAEPLTFDTAGLLKLERAIIEHAPILIIIDPLFAYTGGKVDIHRANECRAISAPLAAIAERNGCAIMAVRHLAKSRGGGHALNAGIGSIDFVAAARSVLLVGKDPDDATKRAVVQTKNNLAAPGAALGYKLEDGCFWWTGASDLTAERILSASVDAEGRSALEEAVEFLRGALSGGEREVKEVEAEARRAGIAPITLRRARERLSVRARRSGIPSLPQKFYWSLTAADDVQEDSDEHHRASRSDKGVYDNELPDDVHTPVFERHRTAHEHQVDSFNDGL